MNRTGFFACLLLIFGPKAAAADIWIAEVCLHLQQPPGYCEIDPALASDAPLVANIHSARAKAGGRLLSLSADCNEVKDWRNGKRTALEHIAQYETPVRTEHASLSDVAQNLVKAYWDLMRGIERAAAGMSQNVQENADHFAKMPRQNESMHVGVVAEDPLVCYFATLRKIEEETGDATQLGVVAATIIKDMVAHFYLLAPYRGRETISRLLNMQRANIAQLQQANRYSSRL
jgi:hypothetical protein